MRRPLLIAIAILLGSVLIGTTSLAVYEAATVGAVAILTFTLLVAALSGLLILFGVAAARQQPVFSRPFCTHCGTRVYETRRSSDRRPMMTCFACGTEWVIPTPAQGDRPPRLLDGSSRVIE